MASSLNISIVNYPTTKDRWVFFDGLYKLYGRKCEIIEIDTKCKNKFLNKYHIQGVDKSSVKLGAFYKGRLVAVGRDENI